MRKKTNKQKKHLLRVGVAVTAVCITGSGAAANLTLNTDTTWASVGEHDSSDVLRASSGDSVQFITNNNRTLTITNNGTANDSIVVDTNTFNLGAITVASGLTGNTVTSTTGSNNNLNVTIASIGASALNVTNNRTTGNVYTNNTTVTGETAVTGAVTVTGGADLNTDANLILQGSTISAGSFSLTESNSGKAKLTFNGGVAQSVTGAINGGSSGKGTVEVSGLNTVATFNTRIGQSKISALNIGAGATANLNYNSHLSATTVTLTDSGNNISTLNFGQTLTGGNKSTDATINGAGAGQGTINITSGGAYHIYGTVGETQSLRAFNVTAGANNAQAIVENTHFNALSTTLTDSTGSAYLYFINGASTRAVSGTIDGAGDNQGTLIIGDKTVNLNSTVGIGQTYRLKLMTADPNSITNVAGGFNVTTTTLGTSGASAVLNFSGSGKTVTSTINGGASNRGLVNVTETGDITFVGNIGNTSLLNSFSVANGGAATFSTGTILAATTVANSGTTTLGSITALTAPTLTNATTGTLVVTNPTTLTSTTTVANSGTLTLNSKLTTSGNTTSFDLGSASSSTINMGASSYTGDTMIDASSVTTVAATNTVTVVPHTSFLSGTVTLVTAATTAPVASKFSATGTNLIDYVFSNPSTSNVTLTAQAKPTSTLMSSLGITQTQAEMVGSLLAVANPDATVKSAITSAARSTEGAKTIAVQSSLDSSGAIANTTIQGATLAMNAVSDRLTLARNADALTVSPVKSAGLSAGNEPNRSGIWVKPYVYLGDQQESGGVAGYKNKTYGTLLGVDRLFTDTLRLGLSGGYSNANIHGGGVGQNDTDVTGYQAYVYGDYKAEKYFVDGMIGYGRSDVSTSRRITFGGLNQVASGVYNAQQYFARVESGRPYTVAAHHIVTPIVGFDYSRLKSDPYTETGAGVLNLSVIPDTVEVGLMTMGIRYQHTNVLHKGAVHQVARLGMGYDVIADDGIATTKFASGTSSFRNTAPDMSPMEGHLGLGLGYTSADDVTVVTLDYDAELREKYLGHTIRLEWRYKF